MTEFESWPNTARLFRDVTITEKLDGTNACVIFEKVAGDTLLKAKSPNGKAIRILQDGLVSYAVYAQSRNRLITPSSDNAGFAKWVEKNADKLFYVLGTGRHYGEWWGQGIGRKYNMNRKVFSVFNTAGWYKEDETGSSRSGRNSIAGTVIDVVPILFQGVFSEETVREVANDLRIFGSVATAGYTGDKFPNPEGICIYHKGADTVFKYTLDGNDKHKWEFDLLVDAPKTMGALASLRDKLLRRK